MLGIISDSAKFEVPFKAGESSRTVISIMKLALLSAFALLAVAQTEGGREEKLGSRGLRLGAPSVNHDGDQPRGILLGASQKHD